jgi:hypothetical protein
MATFNNLSLELVKEKGLLIYFDQAPEEVCQRLTGGSDDQYIIRSLGNKLRCPNCNRYTRETARECWHCSRPLLSDCHTNLVTVKLVKKSDRPHGIGTAHGIVTALLASWNPGRLDIIIRAHRCGSEVKIELSGSLTTRELLLFIFVCSVFSFALYIGSGTYNDYFHCAVAVFLFVVGPLAFAKLRRQQEQNLFDFLYKRLPHLLPGCTR